MLFTYWQNNILHQTTLYSKIYLTNIYCCLQDYRSNTSNVSQAQKLPEGSFSHLGSLIGLLLEQLADSSAPLIPQLCSQACTHGGEKPPEEFSSQQGQVSFSIFHWPKQLTSSSGKMTRFPLLMGKTAKSHAGDWDRSQLCSKCTKKPRYLNIYPYAHVWKRKAVGAVSTWETKKLLLLHSSSSQSESANDELSAPTQTPLGHRVPLLVTVLARNTLQVPVQIQCLA